MKNLHKFVVSILTAALVLSTTAPSYAASINNSTATTTATTTAVKQAKLKQEIIDVAKKYNVDLDFTYTGSTTLTANSVTEFENAIKDMKAKANEQKCSNTILSITNKTGNVSNNTSTKSLLPPLVSMQAANSVYSYNNYNLSWWAPYTAYATSSLFCWKHIIFDFTYEYVNGYLKFDNVSNMRSDVTGLNGATWTQSYSNWWRESINHYCDTLHLTVTGKWFFGISIGGINAGASWYDTWDHTLTLNGI